MHDVEGVGLYIAVCLELGETSRARRAAEGLLAAGVDLRLALQPPFLRTLLAKGLVSKEHVHAEGGSQAALLQRAAHLAQLCEPSGVFFRRHGALLLSADCRGNALVLAEGFNHPAPSLGPRCCDPARSGALRTFASVNEAALAGVPSRQRRPRPAQRHAEVHCLLQLPRLEDAAGAEVMIVELADVGPAFGWAEPCSRGCMQLLMKYGVSSVRFTDGRGGLEARALSSAPDLDLPSKTFGSSSRLAGDTISERAHRDIQEKLGREAAGLPPWTGQELVEQGAAEAAEARARAPQALRGSVFPLPKRRR